MHSGEIRLFIDTIQTLQGFSSREPPRITHAGLRQTKQDISERVQRLCLGPPPEHAGGQGLLVDAPTRDGPLVGEALDKIFDMYAEDSTDALCKKVGVVARKAPIIRGLCFLDRRALQGIQWLGS